MFPRPTILGSDFFDFPPSSPFIFRYQTETLNNFTEDEEDEGANIPFVALGKFWNRERKIIINDIESWRESAQFSIFGN